MKRFRFSLHTVKAIRAHGEVHAREKLAEAVKVAADAQAELANWQQRLAQVESRLSDHRIGRFNGSDVASQLVAYRNDCASRDEAIAALRAARAALTASRDSYVKAKRELEVMEKLETRARAAHALETARAEQAELDEFAGRMNHSQFARP
jgi:flagellar FliJ protein